MLFRSISCSITFSSVYCAQHSLAFIYGNHLVDNLGNDINFIAFFYLRYLYKYILLLTLVLGFFNVINFTLSEFQIVIRISGSEVRFQYFSLFIGILTIVIGYKRIIEIYKEEFGKPPKQILIDEEEKYIEDIHKLKIFYKNKTSDELTQILEDKRYTQTALEAIKQVLNER